jgi:hypothetical protein
VALVAGTADDSDRETTDGVAEVVRVLRLHAGSGDEVRVELSAGADPHRIGRAVLETVPAPVGRLAGVPSAVLPGVTGGAAVG